MQYLLFICAEGTPVEPVVDRRRTSSTTIPRTGSTR